MKSVRGKVVVITGASAGVGRAAARLFGAKGARVALLARGIEGLEGAKQEIESLGSKAVIIPTDVSDYAQVERAAETAEELLGPISIWINNAMVSVISPTTEMSPEEFKRVTDVTYLGQVYGTLAALKRLRLHGRGTILLVGSAAAYQSLPLESAYSGAEHALRGFAGSLQAELDAKGSAIKICLVQLPSLNTPHLHLVRTRPSFKARPGSPLFQPEVAAEALLYAALNPRPEMLVGWPTVSTMLLNRFLPRLAQRYSAWSTPEYHRAPNDKEAGRPDNLFAPVPGDHGAHGIFDRKATSSSAQFWMNTHRPLAAALGVAAFSLLAAAIKLRSPEHRPSTPRFRNGEAARRAAEAQALRRRHVD